MAGRRNDDKLKAAEDRLRILWSDGGTMDTAYGTNLSVEGQRAYCSFDMETLARAYLAGPVAAVRDAERAALERAAEACEHRRLAILADPDDPSWTEHFAELAAAIRALAPAAGGSRNDWVREASNLIGAYQQLAYLWERTGSCPCGARRGSPHTHPHVTSCPTAAAVEALAALAAPARPESAP